MTNDLILKKPVSMWNKPIEISPCNLFKAIGKFAIKGATLDWAGAGESALDTLDSAGLRETPSESAWLLIFRSVISAISKLTNTFSDQFANSLTEEQVSQLSKDFEKDLAKIDLTVSLEFFQRPTEQKFIKDLKAPLIKWVKGLGVSENGAKRIAERFPDYFETALNEKWRDSPQDYVRITEYFNTPFTKATEESRRWKLYNQWLKSQVRDRMFVEAFGVEKVYVPLRGYFEKKEPGLVDISAISQTNNAEKKLVIDLETDFMSWLKNFSSGPAVRFLSGGPGSGKSTFAKIFASKVASETDIPTLYIPLHLFNATDNLISAMARFINGNKFLTGNPLAPKEGKSRLFIIFDGLDELALQGKAATEVASAFVDEVLRRIQEGNSQGLERQVLISGRTISVQSVASRLRELNQITYVLPYFIKAKAQRANFADPEKYLDEDQRDVWWGLYGKVTGKKYFKMPSVLRRESLEEITAQPLLNYLVALSYDQKRIEFADDTTLNQIYSGLISEVYSRQYEGGRISTCVGALKETEFLRVLEEIALAIWHGDGRTATVSSIYEKCTNGGIQKYLDSFQEGAKSGVTRLLTAFYFRQSENRKDGDPTFEFTHKTFGEYLTALRIIRILLQILTQRKRQVDNPDDGWGEREALEQWTKFCSMTPMDEDLLLFVANELKAMEMTIQSALQKVICDLLSFTINNGLAFSSEVSSKDFKGFLRMARNAEETLLAIHFTIAKNTKTVSSLRLKSPIDFGEWISRIRGQRQGPRNTLALNSLGYLDLSNSILDIQDFFRADFSGSNLEGVRLLFAILQGANLEGADLRNAELSWANMEEASLKNANLKNASLRGANLGSSRLFFDYSDKNGANLEKADLQGANLQGANLQGANLQGANLRGANLTYADLRHANLKRAHLEGAHLEGANLIGANLEDSDHEGAGLDGAMLDDKNGSKKPSPKKPRSPFSKDSPG